MAPYVSGASCACPVRKYDVGCGGAGLRPAAAISIHYPVPKSKALFDSSDIKSAK